MSARGLEQRASLPSMTVRGIFDESHPRTERFERLLAAIPRLDLRIDLLIAYILDDTPESQRPGVEAVLREHLLAWHQAHSTEATSPDHVAEVAPPYRLPLSDVALARAVIDALSRAIADGDQELTHWLATTGQLLTQPRLNPNDPNQ